MEKGDTESLGLWKLSVPPGPMFDLGEGPVSTLPLPHLWQPNIPLSWLSHLSITSTSLTRPIVYSNLNPSTILQVGKLRPPEGLGCYRSVGSGLGACRNAILTHSHSPESLAPPTCTLWAYLASPDSDMPKVGKGLGKEGRLSTWTQRSPC